MLTRSLDLVHEREVEHEDGGFTAAELDTVTPLG
jgi:hypothetical protein